MAGFRNHKAAVGSWIDRPGPVPAGHAFVSGLGTCGGPLRPAQDSDGLLLRLRSVLGASADFVLAGRSVGPPHLHGRHLVGHRAVIQRAGEPGAAAAVGAGRTFSQCGGVERQHLSGGHHPWAGTRRVRLCAGPWAIGGLCDRAGDGRGRSIFRGGHQVESHRAQA